MQRISLGRRNLGLLKLIIRNRIKSFHPSGHITICNALHFEFVHLNKICDLLERQRGIIDQPNRGRTGHNWF